MPNVLGKIILFPPFIVYFKLKYSCITFYLPFSSSPSKSLPFTSFHFSCLSIKLIASSSSIIIVISYMYKYIRTYTQIQPTDSAFVSIWFYQLPLYLNNQLEAHPQERLCLSGGLKNSPYKLMYVNDWSTNGRMFRKH